MTTAINTDTLNQPCQLSGFISRFIRRNPVLFWVSAGHLVLMALMLAVLPFDDRLVTGINPWIKPVKFAFSNALYMLTFGALISYLPLTGRIRNRFSWLVAIAMIAEIVIITLQATRGTTSHFNTSTLPDAGLQLIMGAMIGLNTIVVAYVAWQFWRTSIAIPASLLWGIRLGLLIFLLASAEGGFIVAHNSHSVGIADGGPGLPMIGWSTKGGDLRVAHFIGLHALQIIPIVGYVFSSPYFSRRLSNPVLWTWVVGLLYASVSLLLFLQALAGSPLLSP